MNNSNNQQSQFADPSEIVIQKNLKNNPLLTQQESLEDNFGRHFEYLRLSITDVCNFRCNYCLPDGYECNGERDYLSLNEIQTLVSAFAQLGVKKIRITGGEPGLRKDLTDIIALCKQTEGIEKVALTTNGFNLSRQVEAWANAGLDAINVSMDSLDARMFNSITGHQKHEQILQGLALAEQYGIKQIKVNAVLLKQFNVNQLSDFIAWLKDKSITVRFIELMETGDNAEFFNANHVSGESIKQQLLNTGWLPAFGGKYSGPAQEFYHAEVKGKLGLIMPYSKDFCKSCNRLRVSAQGKLHLCLFAEQGIDIRTYLQVEDIEGTRQALLASMTTKTETHFLHNRETGITKHLAMLGG